MSKQIPLTQGKFAIVDNEDFERINMHKWKASIGSGSKFYAMRNAWNRPFAKTIRMAREIMNAPSGIEVDHVNGDTLDNRRSNLRLCTHAENMHNRERNANNTSGYKGVSWHSASRKWCAALSLNGKPIHLGLFNNAEAAARAYDSAAKERFGKFARTNF